MGLGRYLVCGKGIKHDPYNEKYDGKSRQAIYGICSLALKRICLSTSSSPFIDLLLVCQSSSLLGLQSHCDSLLLCGGIVGEDAPFNAVHVHTPKRKGTMGSVHDTNKTYAFMTPPAQDDPCVLRLKLLHTVLF